MSNYTNCAVFYCRPSQALPLRNMLRASPPITAQVMLIQSIHSSATVAIATVVEAEAVEQTLIYARSMIMFAAPKFKYYPKINS